MKACLDQLWIGWAGIGPVRIEDEIQPPTAVRFAADKCVGLRQHPPQMQYQSLSARGAASAARSASSRDSAAAALSRSP